MNSVLRAKMSPYLYIHTHTQRERVFSTKKKMCTHLCFRSFSEARWVEAGQDKLVVQETVGVEIRGVYRDLLLLLGKHLSLVSRLPLSVKTK